MDTHDREVHREAFLSTECAPQEHVTDIMTRAVVEVSHIEQFGLVVGREVGLILEGSQNIWLSQMRVGNFVIGVQQGQKLPHVIQIVPGDLGETELVEVAEGDGGEREVGGRHLVQLGDVGILKVVGHPVHADQHQQAQRAQEGQRPEEPPERHVTVGEDVAHAVQEIGRASCRERG